MAGLTERAMLDRLASRYSTLVRNGKWTGAKHLRAEHVPDGLQYRRSRIADFVAVSMHGHHEYDRAAPTGTECISTLPSSTAMRSRCRAPTG